MSQSPFHDNKAINLLARVGEDLSQLRSDIHSLLSHTTRRTLPDGARELADQASEHLLAGRDYAARRLRSLHSTPPREAAGAAGALLLVGLVAVGVYALCKSECCRNRREAVEGEGDLPY